MNRVNRTGNSCGGILANQTTHLKANVAKAVALVEEADDLDGND